MKVPGGEHWLKPGQAFGGVDESIKRQMIRRTIKEHLDKELRLAPAGDQGAEPVLHRQGRSVPQVRR